MKEAPPRSVLLDLDPAYSYQERLRAAVDRVIPLPPLPRRVCPEAGAAAALEAALAGLAGPLLVFLGSGDYHYLTALLVRRVRQPFDLLLVDRHSDAGGGFWGDGFLTCGGWVGWARCWPWLRRVVRLSGRSRPPAERILARLSAPAVYVSVDKDALHPDDARTSWGEGALRLEDLLPVLDAVAARRQLAGMDVCGEPVLALPGLPSRAERAALALCQKANLVLLEWWRGAVSRQDGLPGPHLRAA